VWAWLLLGEEHLRERLLGATVMVLVVRSLQRKKGFASIARNVDSKKETLCGIHTNVPGRIGRSEESSAE